MERHELYGAVVFFIFGLVTTIFSLQLPLGTLRVAGSGLFPFSLGLLLMTLSSLFIAQVLWGEKESKKPDESVEEIQGSPLLVVAFVGIVVLATMLLKTIGYLLDSFLIMVGLLAILGLRRWSLNLTLSLLTAVTSDLVFVYLLKIPLPRGFLGI